MKSNIHPTWYPEAKIVCACGNAFTTGSTIPELHVEICSACHPYFTGQMKYIDTAGRVDRFKSKLDQIKGKVHVSKKEKRILKKKQKLEQEASRPTTLREARS